MEFRGLLLAVALVAASFSSAPGAERVPAQLVARPGWVVAKTAFGFEALVQRLDAAVKANKMGVVNFASASDGAKAQGVTIAGNRVVGVFRNDFARRMLAASIPSGIEAPIRFYVTENSDGSSTLSYRTPGTVFAPYLNDAGPDLKTLADELDAVFAKIAQDATKN